MKNHLSCPRGALPACLLHLRATPRPEAHRPPVGSDVRVGSNNGLVAPVTIQDGAYTAAGSTITSDVPAGALAVAREKQKNIDGWVARKRPAKGDARA